MSDASMTTRVTETTLSDTLIFLRKRQESEARAMGETEEVEEVQVARTPPPVRSTEGMIGDVQEDVRRLEKRFDGLEERMDESDRRMDGRFDMLETRFEGLEATMQHVLEQLGVLIEQNRGRR